MIILTDVAAKLSEILNDANCPVPFKFVVKSQGYHLDSIANHKTGENRIPVFLTMAGGEYNPVPNLHEANFTYGVTIWFPVRFKEDFYALNEYLEETFVGKKVEIGDKVALCNISVAEYGEITGLHLDQFEQWLEETYEDNVHIFKKEHDISEEYMSMEFRLFCTTLGDGFLFGNDVKYELTATFPKLVDGEYDETQTETLTEQLVWDQSGTGASISPVSEQLIGVDKFVRNTENITNFNKSITVYVKNNGFWKAFLYCYNKQDLEKIINLSLTKTYKLGGSDIEYTYKQVLLSYNENVELGSPLSFTLTFGDGE